MAVYEHLYGAYEGESHSLWSRFLVIPRYALRETFKSKLFTTIFILCFIYPLVASDFGLSASQCERARAFAN
jgi:hypothetical protein